ncbi:peptide deformylase [bacterium]|nr:peptide deformylase [bacterium]
MSKIFDIITHPNPKLRKKSLPIEENEIKDKKTQEFCEDMIQTMIKKDGVGLAAPQVGINLRFVIVTTNGEPICMINPQITKRSWARAWDEEGCLSVPGIRGQVQRNKKINCIYIDTEGKRKKIIAQNLDARIIQHEIDHLDGVLFIDKTKKT